MKYAHSPISTQPYAMRNMQTRSSVSISSGRPLSLPPSLPSALASPPSPTRRDGRTFAKALNGTIRPMDTQPAQPVIPTAPAQYNNTQQYGALAVTENQPGADESAGTTPAHPEEGAAAAIADENEREPPTQLPTKETH